MIFAAAGQHQTVGFFGKNASIMVAGTIAKEKYFYDLKWLCFCLLCQAD
jgi:hypothetical protein